MKFSGLFTGIIIGAYSGLVFSANPIDAEVVHGNVQFTNPSANVLQINNSPNSIINWQQFNIDQNELVRFVQQNADSAVLNRVVGTAPSSILGSLESNGRVFVINPNGVIFGQGAQVNTAGLIVSSLNLNNEDFLNGNYQFEGDAQSGAIENNGYLMAGPGGEIILIAPQIRNAGTLQVTDGDLILAAGEKITLSSLDMKDISFEVQAPGNDVINLGQLIAERGTVGVFADSITHEGAIAANSVGTDAAGNIVLRAQSDIEVGADASIRADGYAGGDITLQSLNGDTVVRGSISAQGEGNYLDQLDPEDVRYYRYADRINANAVDDKVGGRVQVLGERVGLFGNANINASGLSGGGEVLVGGDFQGLGEVQTAAQTQFGANANIFADAINEGDGGRVIVWADGYTEAAGSISARGGAISGDGGFVEVSGKESLVFRGDVNTGAANGLAGTVLFDPKDITISTGLGVTVGANDGFNESPSSLVTINVTDLATLLGVQNVQLQANNDIDIQDALTSLSANSLTLMAGRSITATSGPFVVNTNGGDFTAIANATTADGVIASERDAGAADISLVSGNGFAINTNGGDLLLEIRDGAGRVGAQATMGSITIGTNDGIASVNGDIVLRADQINIQSGSSVIAGTGSVHLEPFTSGATIGLEGGAGTLSIADGSNIAFAAVSAQRLVIGSATSGDITVGGAFSVAGSIPDLSLISGGDIIFDQGNAITGLDVDTGALTLDAVNGSIVKLTSVATQDVFADSLDITAANGIRLDTHLDFLSFNNTGEGLVQIQDYSTNSLTLTSGNNNATALETVILENDASLTISGPLTLSSSSNSTNISALNSIINNGSISNTGSGVLRLVSNSGGNTIVNNGSISANGRIEIGANTGSFTNGNAASIDNNGVSGADIWLSADDFFLDPNSRIDSGALAKVILEPTSTNTLGFALGSVSATGMIGLEQNELDTITGNLVIGHIDRTANISIDNAINFSGSLRLVANIGTISQLAPLTVDTLDVQSNTANVALNDSGNRFTSVSANVGTNNISFADADGFEVRGITAANVILASGGPITQALTTGHGITASTLGVSVANDANMGISLENSENNISTSVGLQALDNAGSAPSLGDIRFRNSNTAATQFSAIDTLSSAVITLAGSASQSGLVRAGSFSLNATGGVNLTLANDIDNLAVINNTSGQIAVTNGLGDLTIVPLGVQNLSTNATDHVAIVNSGGSVNVNGLVSSAGGNVTVTANGSAVDDVVINTDIFATSNLALTAARDVLVNGTSIGGPGVFVEALGGNAFITAGRNLRLNGGALLDQSARIRASGDISLGITNNLSLLAGAGDNAEAALEATNIISQTPIGGNFNIVAGAGLDSSASVRASNNISIDVLGDMQLVGGAGIDSSATMSNRDPGDAALIALNIGGDLSLQGGSAIDAVAAIGTDDSNITIAIDANNISLTAGNGGGSAPGSLAAIGAIAAGNNADITLQALGDVRLTSSSNAAAMIGSDLAGGNINIVAGFANGDGNIINAGVIKSTQAADLTANAAARVGSTGGFIRVANGGSIAVRDLTTTADQGLVMMNGSIINVNNDAVFNNLFTMDGGLFNVGRLATFNDNFAMSGGLHRVTGVADFQFNFTQSGGVTHLVDGAPIDLGVEGGGVVEGGQLNVAGTFDLLGGALTGSGTVTTPVLNHVGGRIAPGTDLGPILSSLGGIGSLRINGDLAMGPDAVLSLDLAGLRNTSVESADTTAATALPYDVLDVNGDLLLGGELELVVDIRNYFASVNDRFTLIRYRSVAGEFASVQGSPSVFEFSVRPGDSSLGVITTAAPKFGPGTIPSNLETLHENLTGLVEFIHQSRKAQRLQKKQREEDEKEDEDGPRKSLICSI